MLLVTVMQMVKMTIVSMTLLMIIMMIVSFDEGAPLRHCVNIF